MIDHPTPHPRQPHDRGKQETMTFGEPGVFLLRPDGTVYMAVVNSMPAARPRVEDLPGAVPFFVDNDYAARGAA